MQGSVPWGSRLGNTVSTNTTKKGKTFKDAEIVQRTSWKWTRSAWDSPNPAKRVRNTRQEASKTAYHSNPLGLCTWLYFYNCKHRFWFFFFHYLWSTTVSKQKQNPYQTTWGVVLRLTDVWAPDPIHTTNSSVSAANLVYFFIVSTSLSTKPTKNKKLLLKQSLENSTSKTPMCKEKSLLNRQP